MALNLLHLVLLAQILDTDWLVEPRELLIGPALDAAADRTLRVLQSMNIERPQKNSKDNLKYYLRAIICMVCTKKKAHGLS